MDTAVAYGKTVRHARTEIFNQDICLRNQTVEDLSTSLALQIQGNALLASVKGAIMGTV